MRHIKTFEKKKKLYEETAHRMTPPCEMVEWRTPSLTDTGIFSASCEKAAAPSLKRNSTHVPEEFDAHALEKQFALEWVWRIGDEKVDGLRSCRVLFAAVNDALREAILGENDQ